jgi:hypothetical protein
LDLFGNPVGCLASSVFFFAVNSGTDCTFGGFGAVFLIIKRLSGMREARNNYFFRLQENIETTLAKQKINAELKKIIPLKKIA